MVTVKYLRIVGYEHDATNRVERNEGYRKGHRSSKPIKANLFKNKQKYTSETEK